MSFPKFIKGSSYTRCAVRKTIYEAGAATTGKEVIEYHYSSDPMNREVYVRLEDIAEFREETNEGMVVLIDRATVPTWVLISDETQKAILKRYIDTSVVGDSRDIIAAISDMKEFMCHLATVTSQEQSKKRKYQDDDL